MRLLRKNCRNAIGETTAYVADCADALMMFCQHKQALSQVLKVLAGSGYTGENFSQSVQTLLGASVEIAKRNELHTFIVMPVLGRRTFVRLAGKMQVVVEKM